MNVNEVICAVDQRFKKNEYVLIRVEEWQTLKTAVSKQTAHNKQSTQGCVICGCNISLRGYCAGCQTRVDQQLPSVHL